MIQMVSGGFGREEWTDLTVQFQDASLPQTWEYGEAKARVGGWRVERSVFLDGERVVGAAQVLVRRVPLLGGGLAWLSRGPMWRRTGVEAPTLFLEILAHLRRYWVEERRLYLRVAPSVEEGALNLCQLEAYGYRLIGESDGWASGRLDLRASDDSLRQDLSGNWRKQLARAERAGVSCVTGSSPDMFAFFLDSYQAFLTEKGFETSVAPGLLKELRLLTPEGRGLWLFEGRLGSERLGSLLVSGAGPTCMFLAVGMLEKGRAAHAAYVMHWTAIRTMKQLGFACLDVGGLDPRRTPAGILQFKRGLRPVEYRLCSEIEASQDRWRDRLVRRKVRQARAGG